MKDAAYVEATIMCKDRRLLYMIIVVLMRYDGTTYRYFMLIKQKLVSVQMTSYSVLLYFLFEERVKRLYLYIH